MCIYPNKTMGIVYIQQCALLWSNNGHRLHITMGIVFFFVCLCAKVPNAARTVRTCLEWCHSYTIMTATSRLLALRHLLRETSIPRLNAGVTLVNTPPREGYVVINLYAIHTYILYAAWYCPARREDLQSSRAAKLSRRWLSACAVGSLRDLCRPCRCVPTRCKTCQSSHGKLTFTSMRCLLQTTPFILSRV